MTTEHIFLTKLLLEISFWVVVIPLLLSIAFGLVRRVRNAPKKRGIDRILLATAVLVIAVFCQRYAVGYYLIHFPPDEMPPLTWSEELFNSFVHTLQTFSMDESYTEYVAYGKEMVAGMLNGADGWPSPETYAMYASALNAVAPVVGGAFILSLFVWMLPKLRLWFLSFAFWKEKLYFSQLNDGSLVLAKSIYQSGRFYLPRPVLVFTNVKKERDDKLAALVEEAELYGAICVQDSLTNVKKNRLGRRKFFLISEHDMENLDAFIELSGKKNRAYLKKTEVYLFADSDAYVQVEKSIRERLYKEQCPLLRKIDEWRRERMIYQQLMLQKKDTLTDDELRTICREVRERREDSLLPVVHPIRRYRNMISNMLVKLPLYEALIPRRSKDGSAVDMRMIGEQKELCVTILGAGSIGTEMFLSIYWIGQMLDCRLRVNIVSKESESEFWDKLDYINPEIRETTEDFTDILKINEHGDYSPRYCEVVYTECDVKSSRFVSLMQGEDKQIAESDYYFVAIGSDEDNISVANTVKRYIGERHLSQICKATTGKEKICCPRAIITYVVYDTDVANALNDYQQKPFGGTHTDVFMRAVGSIGELYHADNVFMRNHSGIGESIANAYYEKQNKGDAKKKNRDRIKDEYQYWSSIAKSMHRKYKMFSAGLVTRSVFEFGSPDDAAYRKHYEEAEAAYCLLAHADRKGWKGPKTADELLLDRLAWLEHRRWTAYLRSNGFRGTSDYEAYCEKISRKAETKAETKAEKEAKKQAKQEAKKQAKMQIETAPQGHKQMDIKLHPCLLECDEKGQRTPILSDEDKKNDIHPNWEGLKDLDRLDALSKLLLSWGAINYDFKEYDYPLEELSKKERAMYEKPSSPKEEQQDAAVEPVKDDANGGTP